jgi:hypothetical protein
VQRSGDPDRLQVVPVKETLPVPPVCDHVIVSPVMVPLKPVTVAVQVVEEPTSTDDEEQLTVVVGTSMVRTEVPELGTLRSSPG